MKEYSDTELLNWMIFTGAKVFHSNDAEFCWVEWSDRAGLYYTANFNDARDAIIAAKNGQYCED